VADPIYTPAQFRDDVRTILKQRVEELKAFKLMPDTGTYEGKHPTAQELETRVQTIENMTFVVKNTEELAALADHQASFESFTAKGS
jgi:hypothetical protein